MQKPRRVTMTEVEEYLNNLEVPEDDKKSNGGLIPDCTRFYGTWLRRNDPVAFHYACDDYCEARFGKRFIDCKRA